jgi:hypothetical protein
LATADQQAIPRVHSLLKWQAVVDCDALTQSASFPRSTIDAALKALGARGLVGFDLMERAYFHREMPFDLSLVEKLQPRLLAARELHDQGCVRPGRRTESSVESFVRSGGVEHRVVFNSSASPDWKCTCPWFARHGVSRGPCKHILAAQIVIEQADPEHQ